MAKSTVSRCPRTSCLAAGAVAALWVWRVSASTLTAISSAAALTTPRPTRLSRAVTARTRSRLHTRAPGGRAVILGKASLALLQVLEGVEHPKTRTEGLQGLANLNDPLAGKVAEKLVGAFQIPDAGRLDHHQPGGRAIDRDEIVAEDEDAGALRLAPDGAVALHADDAVDDRELRHRQGGVEIENALVDAGPVQRILRPAVDGARQNPEHVLQRRRHTDPVVRLELGHRDEQIGFEDGRRQVEASELCEMAARGHRFHVVVVEVHPSAPGAPDSLAESRRRDEILGVPAVPGAFGHDHLAGPELPEGLDGGRNQDRIRRHRGMAGDELDQVRLQDHTLARHTDTAELHAPANGFGERRPVTGGLEEGHLRALSLAIGGATTRPGQGASGRSRHQPGG